MRAILDLAEDTSPSEPGGLPDPASIESEDADEVTLQLREVELRMTFVQLLDLYEGIGAYLLRDVRSLDLNAERYPWQEHEKLRRIVREMLGGQIRDVEVPEAVRERLRWAIATESMFPEQWQHIQHALTTADARVKELEGELAELRARLKKRGSPDADDC
jgi:hypothetical protein